MRRVQSILIMLALLGAAGAIFPWNDRYRLACAAAAGLLIAAVGVLRVRGHYDQIARSSSAGDTMSTVERIREERARRFRR
jgi:hypothetical protein